MAVPGLVWRSAPGLWCPDASEPAEPNKNDAMGHGYAERENCIQCIHVDRVAGHSYANPKYVYGWGFGRGFPSHTPQAHVRRAWRCFHAGMGPWWYAVCQFSLQYIHTWNH